MPVPCGWDNGDGGVLMKHGGWYEVCETWNRDPQVISWQQRCHGLLVSDVRVVPLGMGTNPPSKPEARPKKEICLRTAG